MLETAHSVDELSTDELDLVAGGETCSISWITECTLDENGTGTCRARLISKVDA
jgi:hypothetical protein